MDSEDEPRMESVNGNGPLMTGGNESEPPMNLKIKDEPLMDIKNQN
jgi:hypothetical protein